MISADSRYNRNYQSDMKEHEKICRRDWSFLGKPLGITRFSWKPIELENFMDYSCSRYLNFVTHSGCRILYLSFVVFRVITGCIFEVKRFEHFAECESIAASCLSEVSKLESSFVSSLQQKLHTEHCFTEYWDKLYTYRLSLIVASILQRKPRVGVASKYKTRARFLRIFLKL